MIIGGIYSFNGGQAVVESKYAKELQEIRQIITAVSSVEHKTKISKEKRVKD